MCDGVGSRVVGIGNWRKAQTFVSSENVRVKTWKNWGKFQSSFHSLLEGCLAALGFIGLEDVSKNNAKHHTNVHKKLFHHVKR